MIDDDDRTLRARLLASALRGDLPMPLPMSQRGDLIRAGHLMPDCCPGSYGLLAGAAGSPRLEPSTEPVARLLDGSSGLAGPIGWPSPVEPEVINQMLKFAAGPAEDEDDGESDVQDLQRTVKLEDDGESVTD